MEYGRLFSDMWLSIFLRKTEEVLTFAVSKFAHEGCLLAPVIKVCLLLGRD